MSFSFDMYSLYIVLDMTPWKLAHQYQVYNPMSRHPSLDRLLSPTANIILIWESYQSCQYCINIYTSLYLYIQKWCFDCSGVIGALSFMAYYDFLDGSWYFWIGIFVPLLLIVCQLQKALKTWNVCKNSFWCRIVKSLKKIIFVNFSSFQFPDEDNFLRK